MAEDLQTNSTNEPRRHPLPDWAEKAFRMWCRGQRNLSELARQFNVDRRTVKSNIEKFAQQMAATERPTVDAWEEAVSAQEEILSEAWRVWASPEATVSERTQALKLAQDAIEQIAGLKGVSTKKVTVDMQARMTHDYAGEGIDIIRSELARLAAAGSTRVDSGEVEP